MIDIELHTYNSEVMEVQTTALPINGSYIHLDDRIFLVESVAFMVEQKRIYVSVIELS